LSLLHWLARNGRFVLPAGLIAGILAPPLARAFEPLIVPLIAALLFLAALRIGPRAARPTLRELPGAVGLTLTLQLAAPLAAIGLFAAAGWLSHPLALGTVLVLAAAPITGAPGLALLTGADPVPALRQLVLGTALLPLTALPVFALMPVFADPAETLSAAARLMAIVALAGGGGFLLRWRVPRLGVADAAAGIDGLIALGMGLVVIGLTSAIGPAVLSLDPMLWLCLAVVFALNFGSQIAAWAALRGRAGPAAPALAIVAGNRNLALFLGALPPDAVTALLLFVGCYQIPMYLTPLVMARLYRRGLAAPGARL
jgi:ACR3 family arsenite transporter